MFHRTITIICLLACFTGSACRKRGSQDSTIANKDAWAHRDWVARVARVLWVNQELTSSEIDQLAALDNEHLVQRLMSDSKFNNFLVYFTKNFFRQNTGISSLSTEGKLKSVVYGYSTNHPALWALSYKQLAFLKNVDTSQLPNIPEAEKQIDETLQRLQFIDAAADANPSGLMNQENKEKIRSAGFSLFAYFDHNFTIPLGGGFFTKALRQSFEEMKFANAGEARQLKRQIRDDLIKVIRQISSIQASQDSQNPQGMPYDLRSTFLENYSNAYTEGIPFSSTNFQRARAANILNTYFCEDLVPIRFIEPSTHHRGRHATDPACQGCHYKLDPMAGFFRLVDEQGSVVPEKSGTYTFSDNRTIEGQQFRDYLTSWRIDNKESNSWNIGYIRSQTDQSRNEYGESLSDLFQIIGRAPEAKRCLTKRLLETILDNQRVYDESWLVYLSEAWSRQKPGDAIKQIIKTVILSQTFSQIHTPVDQCLDFAPNARRSNLPCSVSFLLQNKCARCHNSKGEGLNLTHMVEEAGRWRFEHLNEEGNPVDRKTSFKVIAERINSKNPDLRMPIGQELNDNDFKVLYEWLQHQSN